MHDSVQNGAALRATDRFRDGYGRLLEVVVGVLMVLLAVEVTIGVVYRAIGQSLVWYDEIASVMLAWLTFYGSALASVKRAHIGCPELVAQLPPGPRRVANIFAQLLVIGFFCLLGWIGFSILPILSGDTLVSLPEVPMNVVESVIPISSVLIVIAELTHLIDMIGNKPQPVEPQHAGVPLSDALH
jgi:TRAP-type C4-dicarboxylate transport system permease small subunit